MLTGDEREALVRVADRLCAELGCEDNDAKLPDAGSPLRGGDGAIGDALPPEDESLVAALRERLARVAAAATAERPNRATERAVGAALDGAELVIRGELVRGNAERLPELMPSFVFLVTLPIADQDEALELSRRAAELVDELS